MYVYDVLKFSRIYRTVPLNDINLLFMDELDNNNNTIKEIEMNKEIMDKLYKLKDKKVF